ncbi:MAG: hypothetical protein HZC37_27685 [Burkholderiales bacterium]|nr:hypothetical protein [Burkholderiales bacterium]
MARKLMPFYNVEQAVGQGGANVYDDVLLVQYMLSQVGKVPPHPLPPPATPLQPNGVPTPALKEWILWFQKSTKQVGESIIVDGRIDPSKAQDGGFYPPASGRTMFFLNASFRRRFRAAHDVMEADPLCPMALRVKFAAANEHFDA